MSNETCVACSVGLPSHTSFDVLVMEYLCGLNELLDGRILDQVHLQLFKLNEFSGWF
jgi:hypothetical protein